MVRIDHAHAAGQGVLRAVRETVCRELQAEGTQRRAVRDGAEGQQHRAVRDRREFGREIAIAGGNLRGQGLVAGWHALHRIADPAVDQLQAVVGRNRDRPARQAERVERLVQQDARVIARERPSGRVGAVKPGRQPDDQQPRLRLAEGRHRSAEIVRMLALARGQERSEPRAQRAVGIVDGRDRHNGQQDSSTTAAYPLPATAIRFPSGGRRPW